MARRFDVDVHARRRLNFPYEDDEWKLNLHHTIFRRVAWRLASDVKI